MIRLAPAGADAEEWNLPLIMILWTKQFETGSAKLDQQHRLLIDNINLLEEQLQNPNPTREEAEFAVHLVDYLEAYANIHFKGEEKCMESYRCPAHAENQQEHERFRGFIRNYKRLCEIEGFKVELLKNLHEVIRSWIKEHILKIDTQLRPCIPPSMRNGSGAVPES
jgi:hemerythrin-like metal-binding protein